MKKVFSKKMFLPVVAGIMVTVIALAGTFAWFTSTANATKGDFHTAIVQLNYEDDFNNVWNFYPGHDTTIAAQKALEDAIRGKSQDVANAELLSWWKDHQKNGVDVDWAFPGDKGTPLAGKVNFLLAPDKQIDDYTDLVTPGSFIYRHYTFKNASNVPVYFRVKKATVTGSASSNIPYAAYMCIGNTPKYELLSDGEDGYLYYPEPLAADEVVGLMMHAYITGENGNDFQDTTIYFGSEGAELIQATNNAVYLSGTWSDKVAYVPYAPVN